MSLSSLRSLLNQIKFDSELKQRLRAADCAADIVEIGTSLGFSVTTDQIEEAIRTYNIPRGNLYFLLNILMYEEAEPSIPEDKSQREGTGHPMTQTLYVKGTGYDIGGFKASDKLFNSLQVADPATYGALLSGIDIEIDDSVPEFPPILVLRNNGTGEEKCLNDDVPLEELGVQIEGDYPLDSKIDEEYGDTEFTSCVTKVEKLKGIWGKFDMSDGESFDASKLLLVVSKHVLGKGENVQIVHTCRVFYNDMDLNEDVVETRGVSIDYFLE